VRWAHRPFASSVSGDVVCNPVVLAFAVISAAVEGDSSTIRLFVNRDKLEQRVVDEFQTLGVAVRACVGVCACAYARVHVRVCMCACARVRVRACACACACACALARARVHPCVFVCGADLWGARLGLAVLSIVLSSCVCLVAGLRALSSWRCAVAAACMLPLR
jgi:hypothetical protein